MLGLAGASILRERMEKRFQNSEEKNEQTHFVNDLANDIIEIIKRDGLAEEFDLRKLAFAVVPDESEYLEKD